MFGWTQRTWYWIGFGAITLLTLLAANIFYWLAWQQTVPGYFYTGINLFAGLDKLVYFSMVEQGLQGHIMMKNLHTVESQLGLFWSPHWWLIGLTARWLSIGTVVAYHVWRLVLTIGLLVALHHFIKHIFLTARQRLVALCFSIFASGFGAYVMVFRPELLSDGVRIFELNRSSFIQPVNPPYSSGATSYCW